MEKAPGEHGTDALCANSSGINQYLMRHSTKNTLLHVCISVTNRHKSSFDFEFGIQKMYIHNNLSTRFSVQALRILYVSLSLSAMRTRWAPTTSLSPMFLSSSVGPTWGHTDYGYLVCMTVGPGVPQNWKGIADASRVI